MTETPPSANGFSKNEMVVHGHNVPNAAALRGNDFWPAARLVAECGPGGTPTTAAQANGDLNCSRLAPVPLQCASCVTARAARAELANTLGTV